VRLFFSSISRIRATRETEGIWISSARAGMAARRPMTVFDAPRRRAKATRKTPPVRVTIACVARPSLITIRRPCSRSASLR